MARFSDQLLDSIKQDASLLRLAETKGLKLKQHGKDYVGHCPFHDDRTPSFVISPATNLWHCLGACGCGGSVIDFVMKMEGVSFRHAVELLKNAIPLAAESTPVKRSTVQKLPTPLPHQAEDQVLLQQVIAFYHETLTQSPEALAYLESRGLNDPELIAFFKLGYANRSLAYRLPEKNRKAGAELRGQLQRIGVLRESGHEHFNGSLVIPVIDTDGCVTEIYGRKINDNLREGTAYHLYLPGPHAGIFNVAAFSSPEIILCEALIDALTFWRYGFTHVTSSYGVNGFTEALLHAFIQHGVQRVLIAYDRDEAGDKAAQAVAKTLLAQGIECYRVLFPKGMDANEYALKMTPARKSLELVIRKAEWMGIGENPLRLALSAAPAPTVVAAKEEITAPREPSTLAAALVADLLPEMALPASPLPPAPVSDIAAEISEHEINLRFGARHYRVRGLSKSLVYEQLKINLLVSDGTQMHVDHLDLYSAKQRASFIKQAAIELGLHDEVIKHDVAKVLRQLEQVQDQQIKAQLTPQTKTVDVSGEAHEAALALLRDPRLLERIREDVNRAGVVGEDTNALVGYLAAVSRKLENPLAVIIQSTSAAGKSSLMNAVLAMMPEEERIQYSAMTGQSLFYMGETNLKHKILAIAEEEGAEHASYALKLLQSEGELTMASTGKDANGNLTTQEYRVEGPVMLFSTTTAIDIDEELMNRCLVLTVNESREQTQRIHARQRHKRTLAGLQEKAEKQRILTLHRNAQRLLRPLAIVNPYADHLTFLSDKTRTRRDHEKYLALIDTLALLHQYQREIKHTHCQGEVIEYIEVSLIDIALANRLAHAVLGKTLDELPPQTRTLLGLILNMVDTACEQQGLKKADYRFSRRDIRSATGWSDNQLKVHCHRLEELEYLLVHGGSRGKSLRYELLFEGDADAAQPHLMGLMSDEQLQRLGYDANPLGDKAEKMGSSCPQVGAKLVGSWAPKNNENAEEISVKSEMPKINGKTHKAPSAQAASYRSATTAIDLRSSES